MKKISGNNIEGLVRMGTGQKVHRRMGSTTYCLNACRSRLIHVAPITSATLREYHERGKLCEKCFGDQPWDRD